MLASFFWNNQDYYVKMSDSSLNQIHLYTTTKFSQLVILSWVMHLSGWSQKQRTLELQDYVALILWLEIIYIRYKITHIKLNTGYSNWFEIRISYLVDLWHILVYELLAHPNSNTTMLHQILNHAIEQSEFSTTLHLMKWSIFCPLYLLLVQYQHTILCMPFLSLYYFIQRMNTNLSQSRFNWLIISHTYMREFSSPPHVTWSKMPQTS